MRHVYAYSASSGVEKCRVIRATASAITVATGISGQVVRRADLDVQGARYFTTSRLAIEAFVAKAQAAIADASRKEHHAGWRGALADAHKRLEELS
jgi:hypothetical protein